MQNTPLINYGHLEDENITKSEKFVGLYKNLGMGVGVFAL